MSGPDSLLGAAAVAGEAAAAVPESDCPVVAVNEVAEDNADGSIPAAACHDREEDDALDTWHTVVVAVVRQLPVLQPNRRPQEFQKQKHRRPVVVAAAAVDIPEDTPEETREEEADGADCSGLDGTGRRREAVEDGARQ